ncbi:MAG: PD-(D/E)XK nuclease family protein [Bulleidia sp.]
MKKIIASKDRFTDILRQSAAGHNGVCSGIRTMTLSTALNLQKTPQETAVFLLKKTLSCHPQDFPIYADMFRYPPFLNEIYAFIDACLTYDIQVSDLPVRNENEKELARIVQEGLTLDFLQKNIRQQVQSAAADLISDPDTVIYPAFTADPFMYELTQTLVEKLPSVQLEEVHPEISLKYTGSARQEMESVAQDICRRGQPCNVILTSMSSQLPLLKSVFARYRIPLHVENSPVPVHLPKIFASLLRYGVKKDRESLQTCCEGNAFGVELTGPVRDYLFSHLDILKTDFSIRAYLKDNDMFNRSADLYGNMEDSSRACLSRIEPKLSHLDSAHTPVETVSACYDLISDHPYLSDPNEFDAALNIRTMIQNVIADIQDESDLLFLADQVETITVSERIEEADFCTVTDITHPVSQKPVSYVISVDGSGYPGVPVKTGLFDERYLEAVKTYPSQVYRTQIFKQQLEWIERSCTDTLIYSWHTNDYQGREVQLALEIEQKYNSLKSQWDLAVIAPPLRPVHRLDSDTAQALFTMDNTIRGSISTIERYFHCPYSYFIQSGLKVREPETCAPEAASIGTIQHYILETAVSQFGKQYAQIEESQIREWIKQAFEAMEIMHPEAVETIAMIRERMEDGIVLVFRFLKDVERSTSFTPAHTEMRFQQEIIEGIEINGVIDRLDEYQKEFFRIIDYKSSAHALSETRIKAGVQLQLLTYTMIAQKINGTQPAGAYYCSLKQESYDVPAVIKENKELVDNDFSDEAEQARMLSGRKLVGWTFTDRTTELDESGTHIQSLNKQKDYDLICECMTEIYQWFRSRLLQGDIVLNPDEEACAFCPYKPVCRYHGEYRKIVPALMKDMKFDV